jgi:hypothetical protein
MDNPEKTRWWFWEDKALLLIVMTIALLTFAVYVPSLHNGYVYYDDNLYITMNPSITHLDLSFVQWAFTTFQVYNWQPLTWISYALDHALWGMNPLVSSDQSHHTHSEYGSGHAFGGAAFLRSPATGSIRRTRLNEVITAGMTGMLFGIPIRCMSNRWHGSRMCSMLLSARTAVSVLRKRTFPRPAHSFLYRLPGALCLFGYEQGHGSNAACSAPPARPFSTAQAGGEREGAAAAGAGKMPFFLISALGLAAGLSAAPAGNADP